MTSHAEQIATQLLMTLPFGYFSTWMIGFTVCILIFFPGDNAISYAIGRAWFESVGSI